MRQNKRTCLLTSLIMSLSFIGCAQSEDLEQEQVKLGICFMPMDMKVTRATSTNVENITTFGVSCSIYPAASTYTSAGCGSYFYNEEIQAETGYSGYYWPGTNYHVSFFAYAPYGNSALSVTSSANQLGAPTYTYTVPTTIANQLDFVTADVKEHIGISDEPVPLTFNHQCAEIKFNCYNQGLDAITVHSVAIKGVKYTGTCTDGVWTLDNSLNSLLVNPFILSMEQNIDGDETVDLTGTSNHFIMLPQTVMSGTEIFDVYATVNGATNHYYWTLENNLTLQAGKSYTFRLILGNMLLTVDEETLIEDWECDFNQVVSSTNWNHEQDNIFNTDDWENETNTSFGADDWIY